MMRQLKPRNHRDTSRLPALRMTFVLEGMHTQQHVILSEAKDLVFRIGRPFSPNNGILRRFAPQNDIFILKS